jgi:cytoskeleton protein RodZ
MGAANISRELPTTQPDDIVLASFKDIGQTLAQARREQNLTIKQVAAKIHIRQRYLLDLEEGHLEDLPGRVYILGFIRTYAKLLSLDGEELIRRINRLPNLPDYERSLVPTPMNPEEGPSSRILIISVAIICLISIAGYFFLKPSSAPTPQPLELAAIQVPSEALKEEPKPVAPLNQDPLLEANKLEEKPTQAAAPLKMEASPLKMEAAPLKPEGALKTEPKIIYPKGMPTVVPPAQAFSEKKPQNPVLSEKRITIKASEPAWVEVRDEGGRVIFMKVMKTGEEYVVPDNPGVTISTGNSGGINIFVGDTQLPSLGARGVVKRAITVESLRSTPS